MADLHVVPLIPREDSPVAAEQAAEACEQACNQALVDMLTALRDRAATGEITAAAVTYLHGTAAQFGASMIVKSEQKLSLVGAAHAAMLKITASCLAQEDEEDEGE